MFDAGVATEHTVVSSPHKRRMPTRRRTLSAGKTGTQGSDKPPADRRMWVVKVPLLEVPKYPGELADRRTTTAGCSAP